MLTSGESDERLLTFDINHGQTYNGQCSSNYPIILMAVPEFVPGK